MSLAEAASRRLVRFSCQGDGRERRWRIPMRARQLCLFEGDRRSWRSLGAATREELVRRVGELLIGAAQRQCHEEAEEDFREALRLGVGPFHTGWVNLRLGCLADLKKDRATALKYYRKVVSAGASEHQVRLARRFIERPYRGYAKDR